MSVFDINLLPWFSLRRARRQRRLVWLCWGSALAVWGVGTGHLAGRAAQQWWNIHHLARLEAKHLLDIRWQNEHAALLNMLRLRQQTLLARQMRRQHHDVLAGALEALRQFPLTMTQLEDADEGVHVILHTEHSETFKTVAEHMPSMLLESTMHCSDEASQRCTQAFFLPRDPIRSVSVGSERFSSGEVDDDA